VWSRRERDGEQGQRHDAQISFLRHREGTGSRPRRFGPKGSPAWPFRCRYVVPIHVPIPRGRDLVRGFASPTGLRWTCQIVGSASGRHPRIAPWSLIGCRVGAYWQHVSEPRMGVLWARREGRSSRRRAKPRRTGYSETGRSKGRTPRGRHSPGIRARRNAVCHVSARGAPGGRD
jgi:hypothetical protein